MSVFLDILSKTVKQLLRIDAKNPTLLHKTGSCYVEQMPLIGFYVAFHIPLYAKQFTSCNLQLMTRKSIILHKTISREFLGRVKFQFWFIVWHYEGQIAKHKWQTELFFLNLLLRNNIIFVLFAFQRKKPQWKLTSDNNSMALSFLYTFLFNPFHMYVQYD